MLAGPARLSRRVDVPMELGAIAHGAHVRGEGPHLQEAQERKELADAVLQRRAGEAPAEVGLQLETGLGRAAAPTLEEPTGEHDEDRDGDGPSTYLDRVRFVEDHAMEVNGMERAVGTHDLRIQWVILIFADVALGLFAIRRLEGRI